MSHIYGEKHYNRHGEEIPYGGVDDLFDYHHDDCVLCNQHGCYYWLVHYACNAEHDVIHGHQRHQPCPIQDEEHKVEEG